MQQGKYINDDHIQKGESLSCKMNTKSVTKRAHIITLQVCNSVHVMYIIFIVY